MPVSKQFSLFLAGALALIAIAASGCGGGSSSSSSPSGGTIDTVETTPAAAGPTGQITWDLPYGEPISLDYTQAYNYSENTVLGNLCEALLKVTPDSKFVPALAKSFKRTAPTKWVYEIRDGVKFWNGDPLTADDVVASLNRHLDPAVASFYSQPFGAQIASIKKTGPMEVTVTTKVSSILLNEMMATGLGTVAEAKYMKQAGADYGTPKGGVMCTGPYELDSWRSGQDLTITKNPDYWGDEPLNDGVTFKFVQDSNTLTNALLSGDIQGTFEAPVSGLPQLEADPGVNVYYGQSTQTLGLFATANEPMSDPKLRQALSMVIDRQGIADTAFAGAAVPLKSMMILPINYSWGADQLKAAYDELPDTTVDVEAAKKLAAEAKVPDGPVTLGIQAGDTASLQVANAIIDAGKEIGLDIKAKQFPAGEFIGFFFDPTARKQIDMMLSTGYSDFPDPLEYFELVALPGSVQNFTNYDNPTVTKAITSARGNDDPAQRAEKIIAATKQWQEDLPIIPLLYLPQRLVMSSDLSGAPVTFPYQYHPWASPIGAASE